MSSWTQQSYFNKCQLWNFLDSPGTFVPVFLLLSALLMFALTRKHTTDVNVEFLHLGPKTKLQKS